MAEGSGRGNDRGLFWRGNMSGKPASVYLPSSQVAELIVLHRVRKKEANSFL